MKTYGKSTVFAGLGLAAVMAFAPLAAHADSRQNNKNNWRNLAVGAGAVAAYGLLNHNSTATLLGAAGAAYSANRYEQDRHSQSVQNSYRQRYHRYNSSGNSYYHHHTRRHS